MTRAEILDAAKACVCGQREEDYGTPEDVAAMMALLKIARIAAGGKKADSWVDLAGYAACGGEIGAK